MDKKPYKTLLRKTQLYTSALTMGDSNGKYTIAPSPLFPKLNSAGPCIENLSLNLAASISVLFLFLRVLLPWLLVERESKQTKKDKLLLLVSYRKSFNQRRWLKMGIFCLLFLNMRAAAAVS